MYTHIVQGGLFNWHQTIDIFERFRQSKPYENYIDRTIITAFFYFCTYFSNICRILECSKKRSNSKIAKMNIRTGFTDFCMTWYLLQCY